MKEQLKQIGDYITENKRRIAETMYENSRIGHQQETTDVAMQIRMSFLELIAEAFSDSDVEEVTAKISTWGQKTGEAAVSYNLDLSEAMHSLPVYREKIWKVIEEISLREQFELKTVFQASRIFDPILDEAVYSFSLAYVNHHKQTIETAMKEMDELSVPVVPLVDEVGVLPLVGAIDTHRASILRDRTTKRCLELEIERLVIDLSGVHMIDTMVAQKLFQVIQSLRLLGVKALLTGMRPELAQTMVQLGITFEGIQVIGSLKDALRKLDIT